MASPAPVPTRIRFDTFELDATSGELRKAGILLKLQPQPFRVLLLLIERAGQVVTRDEIQRCLWTDSTFVDFDHGINFSINQIRTALSDDAEKPRFVETLPRRGYRFIAEVQLSSNGHSTAKIAAPVSNSAVPPPPPKDWKLRQLTTNPPENSVTSGSLSPDGKYLAYSDAGGIHVKLIETGETSLIPPPASLNGAAVEWRIAQQWFPDSTRFLADSHPAGQSPAFWSSQGSSIWVVSVLGGPPRKLRDDAVADAVSPDGL